MFLFFAFVFFSCNIEAGALGRDKQGSLSRHSEGQGYMVVCFSCGALPVVLVLVCLCFFCSCNIEAGAPGRHERDLSPRNEGGGQ